MNKSGSYFRIFTMSMVSVCFFMTSATYAHNGTFTAFCSKVRGWWRDHPKVRTVVGSVMTTTLMTGALIASDGIMRYGLGKLHLPAGVYDGITQFGIALGTVYTFGGAMALPFLVNDALLERILGDDTEYDVERDEYGREKSRQVAQRYYALPSGSLAALYFFMRQGVKSPAAWLCTVGCVFGIGHELKRR